MFVLALTIILTTLSDAQFLIDYDHNTFTMDGKPFQYVSGSMHYFRCPKVYWRDRLQKMREAGLNAVSTYVEWSQHERVPGQYNFSGELDLKEFIRIAKEEDLYVILRPGPYICAEREMGGLPYWLLRKNPNIQLRTNDPTYTKYVERWLGVVMTEIQPLLYGSGGPIIMVQVENEYGSYPACDKKYLIWLRDILKQYVQQNAVLFTTDGPSASFLKCGKIPGVYATVDFGPGTNASQAFAAQRQYEPKGPLVNSEFYPGWLTHWGEPQAVTEIKPIIDTLEAMLDLGANVNFYMFHGGSNFGFTAGANYGSTYQSDITSYDYNAPLTEAGDLTDKYEAIRETLSKRFPRRTKPKKALRETPKGDYGEVSLQKVGNLLSQKLKEKLGRESTDEYPRTFESLNQNFGYLLYENIAPPMKYKEKTTIKIPRFSDRASIFINGARMGKLSRELKTTELPVIVNSGDTISILVENLGRINYGAYNNDSKGILSNVTLGNQILTNWTMTSFELDVIDSVSQCLATDVNHCLDNSPINIYYGRFSIKNDSAEPILPDSFLDVSQMKKGLVFINGNNLGRYWSSRGPQHSLYVPGVFLNKYPLDNEMVVIDENILDETITIKFSVVPLWTPNTKTVRPIG